MINEPKYGIELPNVYEALKLVCEDVSERFGSTIFFAYGPGEEIVESLVAMSKSNTVSKKKYPLIALVGNTPIKRGDKSCFGIGTLNFVAATLTTVNSKAEQRMAKNYVPVLIPLVELFIDAICRSNDFDVMDKRALDFEYLINFNYAKGFKVEGKDYPDVIDVIELKNLKLKIKL